MITDHINQHFEMLIKTGRLLAVYQEGDSEKTAEEMSLDEKYEHFEFVVQSAMCGAVANLTEQTGKNMTDFAKLYSNATKAYRGRNYIVECLDKGDLSYPLYAAGVRIPAMDEE